MEGIIGSEDDEEAVEDVNDNEGDENSPSQAVLLSEKQTLMEDARKQGGSQVQASGLDDIDDVLGDLSHVDRTDTK